MIDRRQWIELALSAGVSLALPQGIALAEGSKPLLVYRDGRTFEMTIPSGDRNRFLKGPSLH